MKILVISHMYPSFQNKTYGIFIHKQVKALIEQGCEVKVVSPVPQAPWPLTVLKKKWQAYAAIPQQDVMDGVEVYYPRYMEFPRSYLLEHSGNFMYRGIRNIVKHIYNEFKFDLLHAHVALPDGHAAFLLKKEFQVPIIITIHGQDFQSTIFKGEKCRQRLFEVLEGTDRIITVSSKLKKVVQNQPFALRTKVINNGIDVEDCVIKDDAAKDSNTGKISGGSLVEPMKVISVSNLKKTKGIDVNIRAISCLVDKYPLLRYDIIGDGEERQNLEKLVESLNLKDHVFFWGKLPHPEAMAQLATANIFSLPSWQEGFGVAYIEAMAQGLPVIGVLGEGIEDVLVHGQNGLLVRPRSTEDIVKGLDSLLSDPVYAKKLAEAGKNTVINNMTWFHNAEKTMKVYYRLCTKREG